MGNVIKGMIIYVVSWFTIVTFIYMDYNYDTWHIESELEEAFETVAEGKEYLEEKYGLTTEEVKTLSVVEDNKFMVITLDNGEFIIDYLY